MFNEHSNKCNCPHCRGGHVDDLNIDEGFSEYFITDDGIEVSAEPINFYEDDETSFEVEEVNEEELVADFLELLLEAEDEEEYEEILWEFFDEVTKHTVQTLYLDDIKAKIKALNIIKNKKFE